MVILVTRPSEERWRECEKGRAPHGRSRSRARHWTPCRRGTVSSCASRSAGACDAREAAIHLRRTIDDHQAGENAVYWALRQLADFGPEYQDEVAEHLFRLADDPLVTGYERKAALGRLAEFGEPGFAPAATLEAKVAAGELGRKTGRGFHDY